MQILSLFYNRISEFYLNKTRDKRAFLFYKIENINILNNILYFKLYYKSSLKCIYLFKLHKFLISLLNS